MTLFSTAHHNCRLLLQTNRRPDASRSHSSALKIEVYGLDPASVVMTRAEWTQYRQRLTGGSDVAPSTPRLSRVSGRYSSYPDLSIIKQQALLAAPGSVTTASIASMDTPTNNSGSNCQCSFSTLTFLDRNIFPVSGACSASRPSRSGAAGRGPGRLGRAIDGGTDSI
jgi:hypothetical protein